MTEPLKPEEVVDAKSVSFPDKIIEVFNKLIQEHWDGYSSKFGQKEVVERIRKKLPKLSEKTLFDKKYLDTVEEIFTAIGWIVLYNKPAATEGYSPTFEFRKER